MNEKYYIKLRPFGIMVYNKSNGFKTHLNYKTPRGVEPFVFIDLWRVTIGLKSRAIYGWLFKLRYGSDIDWSYVDMYLESKQSN